MARSSFAKFSIDQARRIVRAVRISERDHPDRRTDGVSPAPPRQIPNPLFAVKVTVDGGTAGSAAGDCSWTYTVTTLSGRPLGTAMAPTAPRLPLTKYLEGDDDTIGAAYFDEDGVFQLWDARELFDPEDC